MVFGLCNDEHSSTAESLPSAWQLLDQAKALEMIAYKTAEDAWG